MQAREAEARRAKAPPVSVPTEPPARPEPKPEPQPTIVARPSEPPPAAIGTSAPLNINELERLVEAHSNAPPETVEEWRTYLFFLREHASADGRLPGTFASLVHDVFHDLLIDRS